VVAGSSGSVNFGPINHPAMAVNLLQLGSLVIDINDLRMDAYFIQPSGSPLGSTYAIADSFTILKQANPDSDGDGIPDDYETQHNLDPHDPDDALLDADNDGISNLDEYVLESQEPPYHRVITHTNPQTKVTQVVFFTVTGKKHRVLYSDDLMLWSPGSAWITGDNSAHAWLDDGSATPHGDKRFYRIEAVPSTP
jgi:hypothetical protein